MEELMEHERSRSFDPDWSSWCPPPPQRAGGSLRAFKGTLVRSFVAGGILVMLLFVRQTAWPPAAQVRQDLKYALTTEWDYRPVVAGAVDYGLKLAGNWPVVRDMMAPGSSQVTTPSQDTSSYLNWVPPVKGKIIVPFGWVTSQLDGLDRYSPGVDVAVAAGTPVKAAMAGKVSKTGADAVYGHYVLLDHGDGTFTFYGRLTGVEVFAGQLVVTGQTLGKVAPATTGQPILHFELREKGKLVDPASRIDLSLAAN
ncbi:MAG TPA: M23 family metallopeptidase [Spirochaetia bacterium]|nr:M23 family metallopeptidase [Spirochaetia bacterium]